MTEEQDEAVKWAEKCIEGNRRGKSETKKLQLLLDVIEEQFEEIELLHGRKE